MRYSAFAAASIASFAHVSPTKSRYLLNPQHCFDREENGARVTFIQILPFLSGLSNN
jgi:hypothetical protein